MNKTLPLIMILLVALVGCGSKEQVSITGTFIGGTQGIVSSLEAGSPPTEVFDNGNTKFDINVKLQNNGETEIKAQDVQVKLVGLYAPDFGKVENSLILNAQEDIVPKTKTVDGTLLEGGSTNVIFANLNYVKNLSGDQLFEPRIDVCYKYQTRAVSKVCVLQDILRESDTSFCKISEPKEVQNSGAPLQITKVTESRSGTDKVALTIEISNVGAAKVYKQNTKCSSEMTDKNKVYLTVDTGVTPTPKCTGLRDESGNIAQTDKGYVTLDETGKATITCTQEAKTQTDFEKIVNLKLDYDYQQEQKFQINVKHP